MKEQIMYESRAGTPYPTAEEAEQADEREKYHKIREALLVLDGQLSENLASAASMLTREQFLFRCGTIYDDVMAPFAEKKAAAPGSQLGDTPATDVPRHGGRA